MRARSWRLFPTRATAYAGEAWSPDRDFSTFMDWISKFPDSQVLAETDAVLADIRKQHPGTHQLCSRIANMLTGVSLSPEYSAVTLTPAAGSLG